MLAAETVLMQMSQAIDVLTSWMAANRLLLNPSKTQAVADLGGWAPGARAHYSKSYTCETHKAELSAHAY